MECDLCDGKQRGLYNACETCGMIFNDAPSDQLTEVDFCDPARILEVFAGTFEAGSTFAVYSHDDEYEATVVHALVAGGFKHVQMSADPAVRLLLHTHRVLRLRSTLSKFPKTGEILAVAPIVHPSVNVEERLTRFRRLFQPVHLALVLMRAGFSSVEVSPSAGAVFVKAKNQGREMSWDEVKSQVPIIPTYQAMQEAVHAAIGAWHSGSGIVQRILDGESPSGMSHDELVLLGEELRAAVGTIEVIYVSLGNMVHLTERAVDLNSEVDGAVTNDWRGGYRCGLADMAGRVTWSLSHVLNVINLKGMERKS